MEKKVNPASEGDAPRSSWQAAARNILLAAEAQRGRDVTGALPAALNELGQQADARQGRLYVASQLPNVRSPAGAGFLAVWLGAGVEKGFESGLTLPPILAAMRYWASHFQPAGEPDIDAPDVTPEELAIGLERLGQGLVAHLARNHGHRAACAANADLISELERIEGDSIGAAWVLELLRKRSGEVVVLHVEGRVGARVKYENLSNCFHLFTLLQAAVADLFPGARSTDFKTLAAARGEPVDAPVQDEAWWHYGPGTVPEANLMASVWGEGSPVEIPAIDGQQVLLLWPPLVGSRSWDGGFFGPHLFAAPASVSVLGGLTPQEVETWWKRLTLPNRVVATASVTRRKPWWKFW